MYAPPATVCYTAHMDKPGTVGRRSTLRLSNTKEEERMADEGRFFLEESLEG